jgi:hypothetical protein
MIIFRNINFMVLSVSALESFRLIKVIYMDFYGIFPGPWNLFVKDRFSLNPGSVKDRFHCIYYCVCLLLTLFSPSFLTGTY